MSQATESDPTATILAIIALVLSIIAILIQIRQFSRSGARIVLKAQTMIKKEPGGIELFVVVRFINHGRMLGYVSSYGLELDSGDATRPIPGGKVAKSTALNTPLKIDSSESDTWVIPFETLKNEIEKGNSYVTFRAYALSAIGERFY